MGIPDRIILTLYTFLMAVVAVLVVLCSLRHYFAGCNQSVSGNHSRQLGVCRRRHYQYFVVSLRLLIAGIGATGVSSLI